MYSRIINISEVEPGMKLAKPVYVLLDSGTNMLAARRGAKLDTELIDLLEIHHITEIEIEIPSDDLKMKHDAPKSISQISSSPEKFFRIEPIITEELKEEALGNIKQLFNCLSHESNQNRTTANQCVKNIESVVEELLKVIDNEEPGLIHINDLKHFDEYTYYHSLSVSLLSMATGRELGLDNSTLFRLGRCAMLHDVGKQMVSPVIINKQDRLTDSEYEIIKCHSLKGMESLKTYGLGDEELWDGIMFHHEKINGDGYPNGLTGNEIPLFSRIISVADVYDAVTSYRPHRSPMLPSRAFDLIFKDIGFAFDYDVVKAFFAKLELYPINTIVELSDNRLGIVVECGEKFRLRPTVRIWGTNDIISLTAAANQHIDIIAVLHPNDLPVGFSFG